MFESSSHPLLQENPWQARWGYYANGLASHLQSVVSRSGKAWLTADVDDDLRNDIFYGLAGAYGVVGFVALIQLIRIQRRVPEYGWTTQKVFHLLNFVVNAIRCVVFSFRTQVEVLKPYVLSIILLDLPGLLFFTTYMLLVLFWAEIYHQARGLPTENLRPMFRDANISVYVIQALLWSVMYFNPSSEALVDQISKGFFAAVSLAAAVGFLLYGGRLFLMLRRFPIESRGRRKKLNEVGLVTFICFTCFTIRACMMAYSAFDKAGDLDVVDHPVLDAVYYSVVELIPAALVLFILRKLPPKRNASAAAVR